MIAGGKQNPESYQGNHLTVLPRTLMQVLKDHLMVASAQEFVDLILVVPTASHNLCSTKYTASTQNAKEGPLLDQP